MSSRGSSTKSARAVRRKPVRRKVLVIEDSPVVGPFTADILAELGFEAVGPAPNMASARQLAEQADYDAALLDIHIRGERVFPLCEALDAKGVPFIFTSGYADWQMPDKWQDRPRLQKPYSIDELSSALDALLNVSVS
jgi:DNA-binding response OmpR family regulator